MDEETAEGPPQPSEPDGHVCDDGEPGGALQGTHTTSTVSCYSSRRLGDQLRVMMVNEVH